MKYTGLAVVGILALIALGWIGEANGLFMTKVFAPRYEQVRRQTFEQSKAYNQGMIQELQNMQFQYEQADSGHKAALADIILHRAADYDENQLPTDLRSFITSLKHSRN